MSWDDEPFSNGYKFKCGTDQNLKYDIFSFTLGNPLKGNLPGNWLSVSSTGGDLLEFDAMKASKLKIKGKPLNKLFIASKIEGGLARLMQFPYEKIYIFFYVDEKKYAQDLVRKTFTFHQAKQIGKPIPVKLFNIIPLSVNVFTFEYESLLVTPGHG